MESTCPCCQQNNTLSNGWGLCFNCGCQWLESRRKPDPLSEAMAELLEALYRYGVLTEKENTAAKAYRERKQS